MDIKWTSDIFRLEKEAKKADTHDAQLNLSSCNKQVVLNKNRERGYKHLSIYIFLRNQRDTYAKTVVPKMLGCSNLLKELILADAFFCFRLDLGGLGQIRLAIFELGQDILYFVAIFVYPQRIPQKLISKFLKSISAFRSFQKRLNYVDPSSRIILYFSRRDFSMHSTCIMLIVV